MKYTILLAPLLVCFANTGAPGQSPGDFKSHQSGAWNSTGTWDQWDGSDWINPALITPVSSSGVITIQPGDTIAISASIAVDQIIVSVGGRLVVNAGRTLTILDDGTPAIDLLVAGVLAIDGILGTSSGSTLTNSGVILSTSIQGSLPDNTTNLVMKGNVINNGVIDFNTGTVAFGDSTTLAGVSASTSFYSMRIDSGSTVTSEIPLTIRNNLTVSGYGIFVASADAMLSGNLSVTGSIVSNASFLFPDTTTITGVGSKSFRDVLITGVLTPNSAYTVTGNLSLSGNGVLRAGNSTTTFIGNAVISNSGTGQAAFYNITIPASATPFSLTANADLTILGGTLRWNNGSFYSTAVTTFGRAGTTRLTGTGSVRFNTITVSAGTTFRPNIPCTVMGNVVVNGTLIAGNTITLGGITALSTTGTPTISFNNLAIGRGNSLTSYSGAITINGNFTNNGSFDPNGGTIAFAGNAAKKISGASLTQFNNIIVNNGTAFTDVTVESNSSLTGILTLAANARFDADGLADTCIFTLQSSGDDPTNDASIAALPAGAAVQGQVTVQRYVSAEGPNGHRVYRYISSPVSNAPVSDLQNEIPVTGTFAGRSSCDGCGTAPSLFWYDETVIGQGPGNGYTSFPLSSNSETLVPGRGYALFVRGNIDPVLGAGSSKYDLRGLVNAGTLDYHVTFTPSGIPADDGWNLVGNPYPSAINWNASAGWTRTNLGGSIYMLDNGENPSRYAAWNGTAGTNGGSSTIGAGQAFFVQATGPAPALISDENVKVPGSQTTYFRLAGPPRLLRISLSLGTQRDEAIIHFRDSASGDFDFQYDAVKLKNLLNGNSSTPFLNLSTLSPEGGHKLAINSLPLALQTDSARGCSATVKLDVSDVAIGYYSLEFLNLESFPSTTDIILTDNYTNPATEVDLQQQSMYRFEVTSNPSSFGSARFQLTFSDHVYSINQVLSAPSCQPGSVRIEATGAPIDGYYNWYEQEGDLSAMANQASSVLTTPVLTKSRTYFVAAVNALGCEGGRSAAMATIVNLDAAAITQIDENTLKSNYEVGNHWYCDGLLQPDTTALLRIESSGTYTLVVNAKGCATSAEGTFVITGLRCNITDSHIYPNPVSGMLSVEVADEKDRLQSLSIVNEFGEEIGRLVLTGEGGMPKKGNFDFTPYPGGLYFIRMPSSKTGSLIRIIKN